MSSPPCPVSWHIELKLLFVLNKKKTIFKCRENNVCFLYYWVNNSLPFSILFYFWLLKCFTFNFCIYPVKFSSVSSSCCWSLRNFKSLNYMLINYLIRLYMCGLFMVSDLLSCTKTVADHIILMQKMCFCILCMLLRT